MNFMDQLIHSAPNSSMTVGCDEGCWKLSMSVEMILTVAAKADLLRMTVEPLKGDAVKIRLACCTCGSDCTLSPALPILTANND